MALNVKIDQEYYQHFIAEKLATEAQFAQKVEKCTKFLRVHYVRGKDHNWRQVTGVGREVAVRLEEGIYVNGPLKGKQTFISSYQGMSIHMHIARYHTHNL